MATILSVYNLKGGAGKTMLTTLIAGTLQHIEPESKVLLIDMDKQATLTKYCTYYEDLDKTFEYNVSLLFKEKQFKDYPKLVMRTVFPNVWIVPSNLELSATLLFAPQLIKPTERLRLFLDGLFRLVEFDYVIIDNPPDWDLAAVNSLMVSTHVVIPMQPEQLGIDNAHLSLQLLDSVKEFADNLEVIGFVLNMLDRKYKEHIENAANVFNMFKLPVLGSLIRRVVYQRIVTKPYALNEPDEVLDKVVKEEIFNTVQAIIAKTKEGRQIEVQSFKATR